MYPCRYVGSTDRATRRVVGLQYETHKGYWLTKLSEGCDNDCVCFCLTRFLLPNSKYVCCKTTTTTCEVRSNTVVGDHLGADRKICPIPKPRNGSYSSGDKTIQSEYQGGGIVERRWTGQDTSVLFQASSDCNIFSLARVVQPITIYLLKWLCSSLTTSSLMPFLTIEIETF